MHSMFGKLRWSAYFHSAGFASHLSNYSLQLYKHIVSLSLSPETTGLSTTGTWTIMCCRCMDIEHNAVCVIREFWCGKTACVKLYVFFCLFVFYIFTTFSSSSFFCIVHCLFSAVCQVPWLYAASLQTSAILRFSARFLRNDLNIVWKLCMFRGLCSKSFFFFFWRLAVSGEVHTGVKVGTAPSMLYIFAAPHSLHSHSSYCLCSLFSITPIASSGYGEGLLKFSQLIRESASTDEMVTLALKTSLSVFELQCQSRGDTKRWCSMWMKHVIFICYLHPSCGCVGFFLTCLIQAFFSKLQSSQKSKLDQIHKFFFFFSNKLFCLDPCVQDSKFNERMNTVSFNLKIYYI